MTTHTPRTTTLALLTLMLTLTLTLTPSAHAQTAAPRMTLISDSAASALGLPSLQRTPLPAGTQEIRIWIGAGTGAVSSFTRIVRANNNVTGMAARYWRVAPPPRVPASDTVGTDSIVRYSLTGQCGPFGRVGTMEACPLQLTAAANWSRLWDSLTAAGAWTLPDARTLPNDGVVINGGWMIDVELRDGAQYRAYEYDNPGKHAAPEYANALRITKFATGLGAMVPPRANSITLRGRLDIGADDAELTVCGSSVKWGIPYLRTPAIDSVRKTIAADDSLTRRPRYAVVRGYQVLPARVRLQHLAYAYAMEEITVLELREWQESTCGPAR